MTSIVSTTCAADGTITTFVLEGESLTPLATSQVGKGVSAMALDVDGQLAHVSLKEPKGIATLVLDPELGTWSQTFHQPLPTHPSYLVRSHDGRYLLGADYGGNKGMVWPIGDGGELEEATAVIEHERLHSVVQVDQHVYFVSLGEDLIACYELTDDGELVALDQPMAPAPAGSGPRHVIASPDGLNLYVMTEFSGKVLRYARDPLTGALEREQSVLAHDPHAGLAHSVIDEDPLANHYVWGADLHLAAHWLVASERTASTLVVLPVGAGGKLGERVCLVKTENQPRGFCVTPDGKHVLCPGEKSSNLSLFRLEDDGQLVNVAQVPNGQGANWVRVSEV